MKSSARLLGWFVGLPARRAKPVARARTLWEGARTQVANGASVVCKALSAMQRKCAHYSLQIDGRWCARAHRMDRQTAGQRAAARGVHSDQRRTPKVHSVRAHSNRSGLGARRWLVSHWRTKPEAHAAPKKTTTTTWTATATATAATQPIGLSQSFGRPKVVLRT